MELNKDKYFTYFKSNVGIFTPYLYSDHRLFFNTPANECGIFRPFLQKDCQKPIYE